MGFGFFETEKMGGAVALAEEARGAEKLADDTVSPRQWGPGTPDASRVPTR
jgi:hypothetical protein